MKLIKGITDFCPVCHNKLRTHRESELLNCIEVVIKMGSQEKQSFDYSSSERN